ncbi:hypothetical protein [Roseixanthobacter glucoisosaccharinicivorans]|uniref:hypothetical protein n=1 Tax=Roseixanthobacter glucoisosaccharinicivorans TaxID=3119923 RepID=UPI00372908EF
MSASPRHPAFDQTKADKASKAGTRRVPEPAGNPTSGKPAAGPHAKAELTDRAKTPGTGALPDPDRPNEDATSG